MQHFLFNKQRLVICRYFLLFRGLFDDRPNIDHANLKKKDVPCLCQSTMYIFYVYVHVYIFFRYILNVTVTVLSWKANWCHSTRTVLAH